MKSFLSFANSRQYLSEASDGMLDLSLPDADKVFREPEKFFENEYQVEEKSDGTKLTLFRNDEPFNAKDFNENWIVAYKNNILHPNEFRKINTKKIIRQGMGISQYKLVFEHLKSIHRNLESIPKNTEFLIEFLMSKPKITRTYEHKHGMVLIGYAHNVTIEKKSEFRLYTKRQPLIQKQNEHYAEILQLDLPAILFKGKVNNFEALQSGAENSILKSLLNRNKIEFKSLYEQMNYEELYRKIKEIFLEIPSFYGGKSEGVVLHNLTNQKTYKFLQLDQHDETQRSNKKNKFRLSKKEESDYFSELKRIATTILNDIDLNLSFSQAMDEISQTIQKYKFSTKLHTKKNDHQVREDLHLTTRIKYEKLLDGWAAVIGKFRIVTKEHAKMIEYAMEKYKGVTVMLVTGSREKELSNANIEILKEIFKDRPVEFAISSNGNIIQAERKTKNPIVAYVCGPDRKSDYEKQLKDANNDSVVDVYDGGKRDNVSATKAEQALRMNDTKTLKRILHPTAYKRLDSWSKFYV